jgi:hypothetical protein
MPKACLLDVEKQCSRLLALQVAFVGIFLGCFCRGRGEGGGFARFSLVFPLYISCVCRGTLPFIKLQLLIKKR